MAKITVNEAMRAYHSYCSALKYDEDALGVGIGFVEVLGFRAFISAMWDDKSEKDLLVSETSKRSVELINGPYGSVALTALAARSRTPFGKLRWWFYTVTSATIFFVMMPICLIKWWWDSW